MAMRMVVAEGKRLALELSNIGVQDQTGEAGNVDAVAESFWAYRCWPRWHHQPRPKPCPTAHGNQGHALQRMELACGPEATGCLPSRASLLARQLSQERTAELELSLACLKMKGTDPKSKSVAIAVGKVVKRVSTAA